MALVRGSHLAQRTAPRLGRLFWRPLTLNSRQAVYDRETNSAALLDYHIAISNFQVHRFAASVQLGQVSPGMGENGEAVAPPIGNPGADVAGILKVRRARLALTAFR